MNVVGYCRLSRDEDKENYSSIEEQQNIIREYAESKGWVISKFYIDDNYSGYSFSRPDFKEMIEKVESGSIDIVLAKDLSRIGRNNGKLLVLIDDVFKANERNLILVSEFGGVYNVLDDKDDTLGITTWFNERYVKDISNKVRSSMLSKQKQGKLIMGNYYGYIKKDKTTLIIDEEIRPCIELIYKLYIDGNGYTKIALHLNDNTNYPTPSLYYARKHQDKGRVYKHKVTDKWQNYHIQNIIENDIYTGILRTHKKQVKGIRGQVKKLPESEHFIFENHHEAIISIDDWNLAQEIRKKRDKNNYKGSAKNEYLFRGFVICGDCGYHLGGFMLKRKIKVPAYNCSMYSRFGVKGCHNKEIKEQDLLNQFKAFLMDTRSKYKHYLSSTEYKAKQKDTTKLLQKLEKELIKTEKELQVLINNKIQAIIKEAEDYKQIVLDSYNKLEEDKKQRIKSLRCQVLELKNSTSIDKEKSIKTALNIMDQIILSEKPERKLLESILDSITIYKGRIIEFRLKINLQ